MAREDERDRLQSEFERLYHLRSEYVDQNQEISWNYKRELLILMRDVLLYSRHYKNQANDQEVLSRLDRISRISLLLSRNFKCSYNVNSNPQLPANNQEEINVWRNLEYLLLYQITVDDPRYEQNLPINRQEADHILDELLRELMPILDLEISAQSPLQCYEEKRRYQNPHRLPLLEAFSNYAREVLRIRKIITAIEFALQLNVEVDRGKMSFLRQLQIIGESSTSKNLSGATKRLAKAFGRQLVDWQLLIQVRNKLSHNEWDIHSKLLIVNISTETLENLKIDLRLLLRPIQRLQNKHNEIRSNRDVMLRHYDPCCYIREDTKQAFSSFVTQSRSLQIEVQQSEFESLLKQDINLIKLEVENRINTIMNNISRDHAGRAILLESCNDFRKKFIRDINYYKHLKNLNSWAPLRGINWELRQPIREAFKNFFEFLLAERIINRNDLSELSTLLARLTGNIRGQECSRLLPEKLKRIINYENTRNLIVRQRFENLSLLYEKEIVYYQNLENENFENLRLFDFNLQYSQRSYENDRICHTESFDPLVLIHSIQVELEAIQSMLRPLPEYRVIQQGLPEDTIVVQAAILEELFSELSMTARSLADDVTQIRRHCLKSRQLLRVESDNINMLGEFSRLLQGFSRGELRTLNLNRNDFRQLADALAPVIPVYASRCKFYDALYENKEIVDAGYYRMARVQKLLVVLTLSSEVISGSLPTMAEFKALRDFIHHGHVIFDSKKTPTDCALFARYASVFENRLARALTQLSRRIVNIRTFNGLRSLVSQPSTSIRALLEHSLFTQGRSHSQQNVSLTEALDLSSTPRLR